MPPTFPIFLGFVIYIPLIILTSVICVPMFFIKSKRVLAKKIVATVLLSFPCFILSGILLFIVFLIPTLILSRLINGNYIPQTIGPTIGVIGYIVFVLLVAITSIRLWVILSNLMYMR